MKISMFHKKCLHPTVFLRPLQRDAGTTRTEYFGRLVNPIPARVGGGGAFFTLCSSHKLVPTKILKIPAAL